MTAPVDTSAEAVERLAARMEHAAQTHKERAGCCGEVCSAGVCAAPACRFGDVMRALHDGLDTLRALVKERDEAFQAANEGRQAEADADAERRAVEAERDALRAALLHVQPMLCGNSLAIVNAALARSAAP